MFFSRKSKLKSVVIEDDEGFFNIALPVTSKTHANGWYRFELRGDHQGQLVAATLLIRDDLQSNEAWLNDTDNPELQMYVGRGGRGTPSSRRRRRVLLSPLRRSLRQSSNPIRDAALLYI